MEIHCLQIIYSTSSNSCSKTLDKRSIISRSAIIKGAWLHARTRSGGSNLTLGRLAIKIWCQGYSRMKLRDVKPKLRTMSSFEEAPDIIVLHCGGNDLGQHSIGDLRELAQSQLQYVATLFPTTKIIWSQILPRSNWRYSENRKAMDRVRIRLNNAAATEVVRLGGGYVRYPELKLSCSQLWAKDGTHISPLGKEVFLNTLQGALETFKLSRAKLYPN